MSRESPLKKYDQANAIESVRHAQEAARKRVIENIKAKQLCKTNTEDPSEGERTSSGKKLIGQLKAAEARNRLRVMRLRYEHSRAQEINNLIASQPNALRAVRLKALLPPKLSKSAKHDRLDKLERRRVEILLEDEKEAMLRRT